MSEDHLRDSKTTVERVKKGRLSRPEKRKLKEVKAAHASEALRVFREWQDKERAARFR